MSDALLQGMALAHVAQVVANSAHTSGGGVPDMLVFAQGDSAS